MEYLHELFELWGAGLGNFLRLDTQIIVFVGVVIGIVFGALPGLSASMALSIFIPFTFAFEAYQGMAFLVAMYVATCFGGAISAILVNIPGSPSSVCTAFDGYPMAQRGEAGRAIATGALASALGGLFGLLVLMISSPFIITAARRFGTWENALLALMGLTMISYVSPGRMVKGLLGGALGFFLATVGQDPMVGFPRFTLGQVQLLGGINFVVILIGLFGMAEALLQLEKDIKTETIQKIAGVSKCFRDLRSNIGCFFRSSIIGTLIGAIPAVGPTVANIISYGTAKRVSKNPKAFGTGCPEGLVAAEAADNSSVGGALVPMMTLGIPGCPMTAVLIGALMIHGLSPGPRLFSDAPVVVSSIYIGYGLALIWVLLNGLLAARLYAKLITIPRYVLLPMIMLLCMVGAYSLSYSIFDVMLVIVFGVLGYGLRKLGISPAPIVLGVVLGPILERNLRRSLILSDGSLLPYVTRPVCLILLGITVFLIVLSIFQSRKAATVGDNEEGENSCK